MGVILDTPVLIDSKRRLERPLDLFVRMRDLLGDELCSLSAVSVVELTHGIYRAEDDTLRERRLRYADELFRSTMIHPLTFEIARLAGQLEGEEAATGNVIPFEDLLIGSTALFLDLHVATLNVRHFGRIPGIRLASMG